MLSNWLAEFTAIADPLKVINVYIDNIIRVLVYVNDGWVDIILQPASNLYQISSSFFRSLSLVGPR